MTRRPLRWLLLGGAIVAALLLGVALRVRRTTPVDAVPGPALRADAGVDGAPAADAAPLFRQLHLASGGRLIRIASILPPVLSPNNVPRS